MGLGALWILAKAMMIAAFGTSLTSGAGWLEPLGRQLAQSLARPVTIGDFGCPGVNSEWALANVPAVICARPDVVLVEFSANDAAYFKGLSLTRSQCNTEKLVRTLQNALPEADIFLMTMSPFRGPRRWIRPRLGAYYDVYKRVAGKLKVGYIDHRVAWKRMSRSELRAAIPDGGHPLPEVACRVLVPRISRAIAAALYGRTAERCQMQDI